MENVDLPCLMTRIPSIDSSSDLASEPSGSYSLRPRQIQKSQCQKKKYSIQYECTSSIIDNMSVLKAPLPCLQVTSIPSLQLRLLSS